ncbi:hypothetical protein ACFV98_21180 [Streptomyces violascens]|uniref:hypothetical protein n=1 Tax=Streptomyces violascens TaxID=67381 RepID=UPI00364B479D
MTTQSYEPTADYWESFADLVLTSIENAPYRRAAMALSVSLTANGADLANLLEEVWGDEKAYATETVEALVQAPFVELTTAGWRMNASLAPRIAGRFLKEDGSSFRRVHEFLRTIEKQRLEAVESADKGTDPAEIWFTKTRLAFYLAGLDAGDAAYKFGEAFETAPRREQNAARMWLSTLVLRQAPLLGDHSRAVRFFEGFRAYMSGRSDEAGRLFSEVIEGNTEDMYQAISIHLREICVRQPADRIKGLTESIGLSRQLELRENEVMARNSLIVAHLANARRVAVNNGDVAAQLDLDAAYELAQLNYDRAKDFSDKSYHVYTLTQLASAWWQSVFRINANQATPPEATSALPQIVAKLETAIEIADSAGLADSALSAINRYAMVLRDVDQISEALLKLESALSRISPATDLKILRQLAKTAGSLTSHIPADQAGMLTNLRGELDKRIRCTTGV